jgi:hypothetical protein
MAGCILQLCSTVTVAILAQGTSWAVAVTQAFLDAGSIPCIRVCVQASIMVMVSTVCCFLFLVFAQSA